MCTAINVVKNTAEGSDKVYIKTSYSYKNNMIICIHVHVFGKLQIDHTAREEEEEKCLLSDIYNNKGGNGKMCMYNYYT